MLLVILQVAFVLPVLLVINSLLVSAFLVFLACIQTLEHVLLVPLAQPIVCHAMLPQAPVMHANQAMAFKMVNVLLALRVIGVMEMDPVIRVLVDWPTANAPSAAKQLRSALNVLVGMDLLMVLVLLVQLVSSLTTLVNASNVNLEWVVPTVCHALLKAVIAPNVQVVMVCQEGSAQHARQDISAMEQLPALNAQLEQEDNFALLACQPLVNAIAVHLDHISSMVCAQVAQMEHGVMEPPLLAQHALVALNAKQTLVLAPNAQVEVDCQVECVRHAHLDSSAVEQDHAWCVHAQHVIQQQEPAHNVKQGPIRLMEFAKHAQLEHSAMGRILVLNVQLPLLLAFLAP